MRKYSKSVEKLFKKFMHSDTATLTHAEFVTLRNAGPIKNTFGSAMNWFTGIPDKALCTISDIGLEYRAFKKSQKRDTFRWIVGIIIAIITILASNEFWFCKP